MKAVLEGLAVTALGGGAVWGALAVPSAPAGETWAGLVPMTVAVGLVLAGLWMTLAGMRAHAGVWSLPRPTRGTLEVLGLAVLALAYHQGIVWFGYLLPTAVAAPITLAAFGVRSRLGLALSVVLCPLAFHLVFFQLLGVFPPYGSLFDPLDLLP
ncbi:MAG: tripartite tricarboxylate transporter TctB family protein [Rhodobacterales bacterium]|nr:tripartite tricarboxylate transporter TctB family protein [Rhodobacterales bacterium]